MNSIGKYSARQFFSSSLRVIGKIPSAVLLVLATLLPGIANADVSTRCEIAKIKAAVARTHCLAKEESKKLRGLSYNFDVCETRFDDAIEIIDYITAEAGGQCRYVDNGDGTVSDLNTLLQWEKKDDAGGIHDVDNVYTWSAPYVPGMNDPTGTVFTEFLPALNENHRSALVWEDPPVSEGFAGHHDWRLPTVGELETLLLAPVPCAPTPCIDPIFGPTQAEIHWTSTTDFTRDGFPGGTWGINFFHGGMGTDTGRMMLPVRAVRGGR